MGFVTLFLELALIRYLAGNIWNLGYFPNLVLIAAFVGMGLGFMLHQVVGARGSQWLLHGAVWLLLGLILFVHFFHPTVPGFSDWGGDIGGDLYFTATPKDVAEQSHAPFLVCLLSVAAIFTLLSQRTAKLFRRFSPLLAYSLDIAGSCLGIVSFMLVSWLQIPAWVWFALLTPALIFVMPGSWLTRWLPLVSCAVIAWLVHHQDGVQFGKEYYKGPLESSWSPYQRVQYNAHKRGIYVNGVGHQSMHPAARLQKQFYQKSHDARRAGDLPPYENVLVLGAGSGNDVASALLNGAKHVDAVEIDPVIADLGKRHHPAKPYADPRVNLVIDDGRAFMSRTERRYDLIVFALTDSLVKVSSMSQLRLENYLFTVESVERARSLLRPGGDLVLYNFYRQPWLKQKITDMVRVGSGVAPETIYTWHDLAVLRAHFQAEGQAKSEAELRNEPATAPGTSKPNTSEPSSPKPNDSKHSVELPTDDWPFLYLSERSIPDHYKWAMFGMCAFVALAALGLHRATRRQAAYGGPGRLATKLAFVFMGVAFLLLETKSVIQFSLLFGTTWVNNSLVFLGVLLLVLAANWAALFIHSDRVMKWIGAGLIVSCLAVFVFPLSGLLNVESPGLRFVLASLMTFTPIFFANLIFSVSFRDEVLPEHVFGWNLLGATVGGVIEYTGMYTGYTFLAVIVALCYALVLALLAMAKRARAVENQAAERTIAIST